MFSKIKAKLSIFAIVIFVLASANAASAQTKGAPEQTVKSFYQWYLSQLSGNKNPKDRKQFMLKSLSNRLGKWIYSKGYENYGADYFIDAQDFDENWTVTTTKAAINGNNASLKVILAPPKAKKSDWTQTLSLKLVKEGGVWKIDRVNNR